MGWRISPHNNGRVQIGHGHIVHVVVVVKGLTLVYRVLECWTFRYVVFLDLATFPTEPLKIYPSYFVPAVRWKASSSSLSSPTFCFQIGLCNILRYCTTYVTQLPQKLLSLRSYLPFVCLENAKGFVSLCSSMKSPSTRSLLFLSWYWLQLHKASLQRVFAWKTMGSLGFVGCNVWAELKSCKWMHWPMHCIRSMASTNLSHHPLTTMAFWYAMAMDCHGPKSWSQASCVNIPKSLCINSYDKNHGFLRVVTSPLPNGKGITLIAM